VRRIVVSEFLQEKSLARLSAEFDVVFDPDLYADRPRLLKIVADAEAIVIRNRTWIDTEILAAATELKVVGRLGVGLDNIDMEACASAGVTVVPALGANAVSVAEYVMTAMLILTRPVFGMTESMVAGDWPRQGHAFGRELMGTTLGLVGYGSIARTVAIRAAAFDMTIVAYDPFLSGDDQAWKDTQKVELDELLVQADVISLHIPLNEGTKNLIDATQFERMKPRAILINTSRGGTVNEPALARALRKGLISGAAIDVFASEPLGPEPAATFAGLDNVILTPHIAGNTIESVDRVANMITDAVIGLLKT
jgi:(S)-sulfolactate dehydrogenase